MPPLAPVTSATVCSSSASMGGSSRESCDWSKQYAGSSSPATSGWTRIGWTPPAGQPLAGTAPLGSGGPLFEVAYETTFCATHVLTDGGRPIEPVHGHDWRVEVVAAGETLDRIGVVVDFEHLKAAVGEVCRRFHYKDINPHPPLPPPTPPPPPVAPPSFAHHP